MKKIIIVIILIILALSFVSYFYWFRNTGDNFVISETTERMSNKFMGITFDYPDNLHTFLSHYTKKPDDTISFFDSENIGPFIEVTLKYQDFNPQDYDGKFGKCGEEPEELKPILFSLFTQKAEAAETAEAFCGYSYKVKNIASMKINGKTFYSYSIKSDLSSSFPSNFLGVPGVYSDRTDYFILPGEHYFIEFKFSGIEERIIRNFMFSVKQLSDEHSVYLNSVKPAF